MSSNVTYSIRLMLTSWVTSRVVRISGESGILIGMATVVGIPDVPLSGISMAAPIIHLLLRK